MRADQLKAKLPRAQKECWADWYIADVLEAARIFNRRKDMSETPQGTWGTGKFGNSRKWFPVAAERRSCCSGIREPSLNYPLTLLKHCCSAVHVAELAGGVVAADVIAVAKLLRAEGGQQ